MWSLLHVVAFVVFFFKTKTAYDWRIIDWCSDVCSSDLYVRWIIGGLFAALLAFGGYLFWDHRQDVARGEQAEELIAAFEKLATNQPRAATAELQKIAAEGGPAYRAAAQMPEANIKAQAGDLKGAAALTAKADADTKLAHDMRALVIIRPTPCEY